LKTATAIQLLISVTVDGMSMPTFSKLVNSHSLNHKPLYLAGRPSLQFVQVSFTNDDGEAQSVALCSNLYKLWRLATVLNLNTVL
jgi:hypothetical protein